MLDRDYIINYLKDFCIDKPFVNAMWLEGADGVDRVDEYSDIDFWFDVSAGNEESFLYELIEELLKIGDIDSRDDNFSYHIKQSNIHLSNTSEYLMLDLCVQSSDVRGLDCTCFVKGDIAELPKIIFDKKNIITFKDEVIDLENIKLIFKNNVGRIMQDTRVTKYFKRDMYLEAYDKYIRDVFNPFVKIVRLLYTPNHTDYVLCHINDHLPKDEVLVIEELCKVTCYEDIENNIRIVKEMLDDYKCKIESKYDLTLD